MKKYLLVILLLTWSTRVFSEDIDLYLKNTSSNTQRPNVLIILDTSSSMGDITWVDTNAFKARKIIIDLINDNPEVDFALQVFNRNNNSDSNNYGTSNNGGRIIFGFKDLSVSTNKTELLALLDNDLDNTNNNYKKLNNNGFTSAGVRESPYTYTPLCETLYETYRYLSGGEVYYGKENNITPLSIISSGNYDSPFDGITCDKEVTIIYITDGEQWNDTNANGKVRTLLSLANSSTASYSVHDGENTAFLGLLGSWMATRNWNSTEPFTGIADTLENEIVASVKIHTVGFGAITSDSNTVTLLKQAARHGVSAQSSTGKHARPAGGKYHAASTAEALKTSLDEVLLEVLDSSTLTSASVSANSLDRTQTLDSVYYGMFEPSTSARWQGNLKKYKIVNGAQVDVKGNLAVNSAGEFDKGAKSFWSTTVDGNDVAIGGVAEMLRTTLTIDRKLLTDIEGVGELTEFNYANIIAQYTTLEALTLQFGEATDIFNHVEWARGVDVDDYDKDTSRVDVRPDVFGDPLHSKPIAINYGTGNSRIVVGTNVGVLHMFEDVVSSNTVKENWAYLPKEFFKNIKPLRENAIAVNNKVYGLDGEITLHVNDINNDGKVNGSDSAWLFFGLRRGGSSYYALDITDPDKPKLMWHKGIKSSVDITTGFETLGQTWSKPQVVRSAFNTTDSDKLVIIFGGGYDTKKDAPGPNTHDDNNGAAVYMLNARTGSILLNILTGSKNGIASSIASLDSDNDALIDRLYVGDTGGNVWRIDMPDETLAHTSVIKLASVGGSTNTEDRRFFNPPSIVRTYILETIDTGTEHLPNIVKQTVPYDAILLGSGDRATPTDTDTNDMFFMFKDKYIKTQPLDTISPAIAPITLRALYDYTDDPFKGYPILTTEQKSDLTDASLRSGWHFDLTQGGEKSSSEAIVINNVIYFTSYTPAPTASCSVTPGDAWLYAIDLALGIKKYNWGADLDNRNGDYRIKHMGSQFLGRPTLLSTEVTNAEGVTSLQGDLIVGKQIISGGFSLQTMRTSLTIEEN